MSSSINDIDDLWLLITRKREWLERFRFEQDQMHARFPGTGGVVAALWTSIEGRGSETYWVDIELERDRGSSAGRITVFTLLGVHEVKFDSLTEAWMDVDVTWIPWTALTSVSLRTDRNRFHNDQDGYRVETTLAFDDRTYPLEDGGDGVEPTDLLQLVRIAREHIIATG